MKNNMIAQTVVNGNRLVSTVWLGFMGPYETMVFACDADGKVTNWRDLDCVRSTNLGDAVFTHETMVNRLTNEAN